MIMGMLLCLKNFIKMDEIRKSLDIAPFVKETVPSIEQTEDDFEFARNNLYDIIGKSQTALEDMIDVARQSQHPRAYEVLNQMLKTVADVSKDLIELQKKKQDIMKIETAQEKPTEVHNNLYITTNDLNKMIEDAKASKEDNAGE